jgi:hypothetical protein
MAEKKVATEVAEQEFARFLAARDLDADTSDMSSSERETFDAHKRRVIRAVERGALSFDSDGMPRFQPADGRELLKFREPTGRTMLASGKGDAETEKLFASLGELTGEQPVRFHAMPARDVKVCGSLFVLLFS